MRYTSLGLGAPPAAIYENPAHSLACFLTRRCLIRSLEVLSLANGKMRNSKTRGRHGRDAPINSFDNYVQ